MIKRSEVSVRILKCAWCGEEIGRYPEPWEPESYESHGICERCNEREFGNVRRLEGGER